MGKGKDNKRARASGSSRNREDAEEEVFVPYKGRKFLTSEAQEEYSRLMSITVAKERGLVPTWGVDGAMCEMIQNMGWGIFCQPPEPVPLSVVREFYAHAKAEKNGFSWVRGKIIEYTPRAIREILGQPPRPENEADWVHKTKEDDEVDLDHIVATICVPGTEWKRRPATNEHITFPTNCLNRYAKAWNLFICANLMPSGHTHNITVERAILLWGVLNQKYIDAGYLVHQNILQFLRRAKGGAMPHACVITGLCHSAKVKWAPDEPVQACIAPIDHTVIRHLSDWAGGIPEPHGLGYQPHPPESPFFETPVHHFGDDMAGSSQQYMAGSSQPHTADLGDTSGMTDSQYRRLIRRIDASHNINRQSYEALTRALDQQRQGIIVPWPIFGAGSVYPPPDSPPEEGDHAGI